MRIWILNPHDFLNIKRWKEHHLVLETYHPLTTLKHKIVFVKLPKLALVVLRNKYRIFSYRIFSYRRTRVGLQVVQQTMKPTMKNTYF